MTEETGAGRRAPANLIGVRETVSGGLYRRVWKRVLDVILSAAGLVLLAAPMFLIALFVRLDSPGRALFAQERIGREGNPFRIWKFRTMRVNAPHRRASASFSKEEKARCLTRFGRFLRRSSLDELPQLWNVLKGEMSLIGPRPVIDEERELIALRDSLGVLDARPGITGYAQVLRRNDPDPLEKAGLDAYYVRRISPLLDGQILFWTVCRLFSGE